MSQSAKPGTKPANAASQLPPIKRVAGVSNGPRAQGKVVIITGRLSPRDIDAM